MDQFLRANIHKLPWPRVDLEEVGATDFFYTDGAACGSSFKLIFKKDGVNDYLGTVYVFSDGTLYSRSQKLLDLVEKWVEDVKTLIPAASLTETVEDEDPHAIWKDTPLAPPENRSPASPPTN